MIYAFQSVTCNLGYFLQVRRLEAAIRKETVTDGHTSSHRKRQRDPENEVDTVASIDNFRQMGIQQLREEASRRGISVTGSKKQLLERICDDLTKDSDNADVGMVLCSLYNLFPLPLFAAYGNFDSYSISAPRGILKNNN